MNPLRTLENMIAGLVEGTFGRVFRAEVRPMELAHKLAREMDENKTASVSRVYAPNEYSVWLSPRDRARYEGVEQEVIDELCAYLLEHARGENLALASRPHIVFHTDEALHLGEFGIEARMTRVDEPPESAPAEGSPTPRVRASRESPPSPEPEPSADDAGHTMIFSNSERVSEAVADAGGRRRAKALLLVSGRRLLVPPRGAVIGRSRDCDIVLDDAGVSRRHAELRPEASTIWTIEDLGSTNGVRVNGLAVAGAHPLRTGDRIGMGSTEMTFEVAP
ncbi:MAG: FhaA domain-containing protein [Solirubrobacteraceae bacterium]